MKPDLYTKIVLTVISLALTGILLKDYGVIPKAVATPLGTMDVNIESVDPHAFRKAIPVRGATSREFGMGEAATSLSVEVTNTSDFGR
jgi:hypothetical protein